MQKVLICSTSSPNMKAEIWGWSEANPEGIMTAASKYPDKDIWNDVKCVGFIDATMTKNVTLANIRHPITPLHALALGWKLLHPPINTGSIYDGDTEHEWWFVRED